MVELHSTPDSVAQPPVTAREIYHAAGKALGRPIKVGMDKGMTRMTLELNEYLHHRIDFVHAHHDPDVAPLLS